MGACATKPADGGAGAATRAPSQSSSRKLRALASSRSITGHVAVSLEGYELLGTLGHGAFARVERARHVATGEERAVKVFERAVLRRHKTMLRTGGRVVVSSALDKLEAEIRLMREFDHGHVIRLHDVIDDAEADRTLLVLELAAKGPVMTFDAETRLFSCVDSGAAVEPDRAARYLAELASALSYLHMRHVAHRDLKPDNILLDHRDAVKVCDFGVSHKFTSSLGASESDSAAFDRNLYGRDLAKRLRQISKEQGIAQIADTEGTYAYWAPEMITSADRDAATFNAFACDVWALGVCFYNFRARTSPFEADTLDGLFDRIAAGTAEPTAAFSADEARVLAGLLEKDPAARTSLGDLLEDPYLVRHPVHESRSTDFRNTPRERLARRGSLRGGFAGRSGGTPAGAGDALRARAGSLGDGERATLDSSRHGPPDELAFGDCDTLQSEVATRSSGPTNSSGERAAASGERTA